MGLVHVPMCNHVDTTDGSVYPASTSAPFKRAPSRRPSATRQTPVQQSRTTSAVKTSSRPIARNAPRPVGRNAPRSVARHASNPSVRNATRPSLKNATTPSLRNATKSAGRHASGLANIGSSAPENNILHLIRSGNVDGAAELINIDPSVVQHVTLEGVYPLAYLMAHITTPDTRNAWFGVIKQMIQHGSSIINGTYKNRTALEYAVEYGWPDIVDALLRAGASPNIYANAPLTDLTANSEIKDLLID